MPKQKPNAIIVGFTDESLLLKTFDDVHITRENYDKRCASFHKETGLPIVRVLRRDDVNAFAEILGSELLEVCELVAAQDEFTGATPDNLPLYQAYNLLNAFRVKARIAIDKYRLIDRVNKERKP